MNTLGKTVVAIGVSIVIILALIFSRDVGAPFGYKGDGFGTPQEAIEDGVGASYSFESEIGKVEFDDGIIYVCKSMDNHVILSYMFRNRQQTKYYLESYYVVNNLKEAEWHTSKNKTKTNYKLTDGETIINECDNMPVQVENYSVTLNKTEVALKLYYNRAEGKK